MSGLNDPELASVLADPMMQMVPPMISPISSQEVSLCNVSGVALPEANALEAVEWVVKESLKLRTDFLSMWFCRCTSRRRQTPEKGPWLTRAQKDLLSKLEDVNLLEMFSKRAGDILRSSTTDGLTSLCCLFISACRVLGDVKKVHMFACDLLTLQGYCRFVTAMASMWPLPLRRANNEYIPIIRVLQHFFFVKLVEESKEEQQKMKVCLEWLCAWSCGPQAVNEVAENILSDVKDVLSTSIFINQELSWNAELAFDLLCHLEGWQWASGFVISKLLCPIIGNWTEKPDEAKEQFIQSVVHVLGRVMSHCPVTCPSSADQVVNSLLTLLKESAVPLSLQRSVLNTLVFTTRHCTDRRAMERFHWGKGRSQ